jgi:hypothetical protein
MQISVKAREPAGKGVNAKMTKGTSSMEEELLGNKKSI